MMREKGYVAIPRQVDKLDAIADRRIAIADKGGTSEDTAKSRMWELTAFALRGFANFLSPL